jgi:hypothetical protein
VFGVTPIPLAPVERAKWSVRSRPALKDADEAP